MGDEEGGEQQRRWRRVSRRWRQPVAAAAVAPSSLSLGRVGGGECGVEVVVVMVAVVVVVGVVVVMVVVVVVVVVVWWK